MIVANDHRQNANIGEAARIMLDNKFSGLPVVDESTHSLIITGQIFSAWLL
jgi:CBS domain-containing protein